MQSGSSPRPKIVFVLACWRFWWFSFGFYSMFGIILNFTWTFIAFLDIILVSDWYFWVSDWFRTDLTSQSAQCLRLRTDYSVGEIVHFSIFGPGSYFESVLRLESESAWKIMEVHRLRSWFRRNFDLSIFSYFHNCFLILKFWAHGFAQPVG